MMVATGLPLNPAAPSATKTPAADAASTAAPADGFLGTLLQMLAAPESGQATAGVADVLLDSAQEDSGDDPTEPDAVNLASLLPVVLAVPVIQPADIRTAQLLARTVRDGAPELANVLDAVAETEVAAAGLAETDPERLLLGLLQGTAVDSLPRPASDSPAPSLAPHAVPVASEALNPARPPEVVSARQLHSPVGAQAWTEELGTQLHMMADKGHSLASLRLSPEHLGPLEIQIAVNDDQATVWFGAAHADTRAALEQAMPRLRELFAAQGMSLLEAGVFSQTSQNAGRQPSGARAGESASASDDAAAIAGSASRRGLVDAYA